MSTAHLFWLTLLLAPFVHEDVAIVTGGMLVATGMLPTWGVAAVLVAGFVASDIAIYGLGMAAHRSAWLRQRLVGARVDNLQRALASHLGLSVALCHLLPGVLFPTFLACGWLGLSFRRFAAASAVTALVYVPIALGIVVLLGQTVLHRIGHWAWALVLALVLVATLRGSVRQVWAGLLVFDRERAAREIGSAAATTHRGMPSLPRLARRISVSERVPTYLFYLPLALRWLVLGIRHGSLTLPTLANPNIEGGGLWGESKSALMLQIGAEHRHWLAPFVTVRRDLDASVAEAAARAVHCADDAGLVLPLVAKPDLGWQGYGVQRIDGATQLGHYLAHFPPGETIILQQLVPYDGEAGVYYARLPGEPTGKVVGLAFRYFPCVVGDARSSLRALIAADPRARFKSHRHLGATRDHLGLSARELDRVPAAGEVVRLAFVGSLRVGGLYKDAAEHITPALSARFDAIARSMYEFYFGRFDIRFESVGCLRDGEAFAIIEINGAGSEPIQAWDPDRSMRDAYAELFRFQSLMFEIAARNRARGLQPMPLGAFLRLTRRYARLLDTYPPSG